MPQTRPERQVLASTGSSPGSNSHHQKGSNRSFADLRTSPRNVYVVDLIGFVEGLFAGGLYGKVEASLTYLVAQKSSETVASVHGLLPNV